MGNVLIIDKDLFYKALNEKAEEYDQKISETDNSFSKIRYRATADAIIEVGNLIICNSKEEKWD